MQFSTDDEEFEEVVADFDTTAAVLGQGEALARSAQPINYLPGKKLDLYNVFESFTILLIRWSWRRRESASG